MTLQTPKTNPLASTLLRREDEHSTETFFTDTRRAPSDTRRRFELAVFDLESTVPESKEQRQAILEFGTVIVDMFGQFELASFGTLVHNGPITPFSVQCNGITEAMVERAPKFQEIADRVFDLLDGRVWVGHNIGYFDIPLLNAEFAACKRKPPKPCGVIDTLTILRELHPAGPPATPGTRGKPRAGSHKLAHLGLMYDAGVEDHRAVSDCRMTIEVLRKAATSALIETRLGRKFEEDALHPLLVPHLRTQGAVSCTSPTETATEIEALFATAKLISDEAHANANQDALALIDARSPLRECMCSFCYRPGRDRSSPKMKRLPILGD